MPINYPGPYEVRIFYKTNEPAAVAQHVFRLSCDMLTAGAPGDPFPLWSAKKRDGTGIVLSTAVDALVVLIKPFFNTSTDISYAELWEYTPGTFDAIFRSTYTIGVAGTSATATSVASQLMVTFRTVGGGILKVDLRGTIFGAAVFESFPTSVAGVNSLAGYFNGATSPWIGRDGTFPLSAVRYLPGINEHAWKIINR